MAISNPKKFPVQEAWIAPAFQNGWTNATLNTPASPAGYWKDSFGVVHLRGVITGSSIGQTIFVLPVGYRPTIRSWQVVYTRSSGGVDAVGRLNIDPDGAVSLGFGNTNQVNLDTCTFRTA